MGGPLEVPVDGRQSETATAIARGVRRLLRAHGFATVAELPLTSGRRADVVGVNGEGTVVIVEIKSSVADFRADHKWRLYFAHCDRLYFAVDADMPLALMPDEAGLIVADSYGGEILREPPARAVSPAARRAVLLRFALAAADRLHRLADPGVTPER